MSPVFPCQAPTGYFHYLALALLVHCCITVSGRFLTTSPSRAICLRPTKDLPASWPIYPYTRTLTVACISFPGAYGLFSLPRASTFSALLHHCVWLVSDHIPQYSYLSETNQGLASLLANLSIDKDIKCHLPFLARRLRAIFITSRQHFQCIAASLCLVGF